jgi:trans-aconitate methyltransferase
MSSKDRPGRCDATCRRRTVGVGNDEKKTPMTNTQTAETTAGDDSIFKTYASKYAAFSQNNPINRDYDRPTVLRLIGDISSKRVLELGCAAGGLTTHLVQRGAEVIAVDAQPQMIALARQRLGSSARFEVADLARPPLNITPAASIDVVVASLVLHYIKDWTPLLQDLSRCLVPGGALVASMHHPITAWLLSDRTDYHRVELVSETWDWDGLQVTAQSYRRPLSSIFGELRQAGFAIDVVEEPRIQPESDIDPDMLQQVNTQPFFLFIRAVRAA